MTGSGKTTLLKALIAFWAWVSRDWYQYHIVILDTKKDGDFDGMGKKFRHLKDLNPRNKGGKGLWDEYRILIYEPVEEEMNDEFYDGFFRFLRQTGEPLLVVIDELASVAKGNKVSYEYELLMKQGRGKFQMVWAGIQNPVYVPHDFLSNANHYFVFDLMMDSDRDKMAGIVGKAVTVPPPVREEGAEHGFYYYSVKKRKVIFHRNDPPLKLPVPPDFNIKAVIKVSEEQRQEGGSPMNWKWIWAWVLAALLILLIAPLWKMGFDWLAERFGFMKPVAAYVNKA